MHLNPYQIEHLKFLGKQVPPVLSLTPEPISNPYQTEMDALKLARLVDRMASKRTLADCMTVFVDIMEYEDVSQDLRPALFRRAWAALGDRCPVLRNCVFVPGRCRTSSENFAMSRLGF